MQYVRSLGDSVSTAWNSINPATLSGAIDVIVVEQEDGTLACSPFHVRFGKFSLLRPSEKKVEFRVNGVKQDYAMKLGEGGEAFFVFETTDTIPQSMQTSPIVSPASSPPLNADQSGPLQEPESLDLNSVEGKTRSSSFNHRPPPTALLARDGKRLVQLTRLHDRHILTSMGYKGCSHLVPYHQILSRVNGLRFAHIAMAFCGSQREECQAMAAPTKVQKKAIATPKDPAARRRLQHPKLFKGQ